MYCRSRTAEPAIRHRPDVRAKAGQLGADGNGCARHGSRVRSPGSARQAGCRARRHGGGQGHSA